MAFPLDLKVKKAVLDAIGKFLDSGIHQDVVVEYTVKKDGTYTSKFSVVENGCHFFSEAGFDENGLKSFVKNSRTLSKHGYVLFETYRLGDALSVVSMDLENIERDLHNKIS